MMGGVNKVILVGHLGKAPDLRYLNGDIAVTTFPLATTENISKNGVREEITDWHNIVLWRSLAEMAAKMLQKGQLVYIEGKIRTRSFTDKAGIVKYITEIVVEKFSLLGHRHEQTEAEIALESPDYHQDDPGPTLHEGTPITRGVKPETLTQSGRLK